MEVAPRYKLPLSVSVSVNTVYTFYNVYSIQTALHCLNSSMYACVYCVGKQNAIRMGWWAKLIELLCKKWDDE